MKYIYSLRNSIEDLIAQKNTYILGEDIIDPYGGAFKVTKGLSLKYPNNVIGVPMSEQGFTSISVGMALCGEYVIEEIMFGDFITLVADQMINHAAKFYDLYGQKMHLVLRTPSGAYRGYGSTHSQSIEKIFLGIPGLKVVAANRYCDVGELLKSSIECGIPTLFVENKLDYSKELLLDDFDIFERSQCNGSVRIAIKGEEPDITIITYGGISDMAVQVAKRSMLEEEIVVDTIIVSNLSENIYLTASELIRTEKVIIVEETTGEYGYSAQVAYELCRLNKDVSVLTSLNSSIPSAQMAEYEVLIQEEDIYNEVISKIL